jgi:hypothetical protein
MLRHVVWQKLTDVSEVLTASIIIIALTIDAVSTSKTSANLYETTRRNTTKDSHLPGILFVQIFFYQLNRHYFHDLKITFHIQFLKLVQDSLHFNLRRAQRPSKRAVGSAVFACRLTKNHVEVMS